MSSEDLSLDEMLCYGKFFDSIKDVNAKGSSVKISPQNAFQNVAKILNEFMIYVPQNFHSIVQYSFNPEREDNQSYNHFLLLNIVQKSPFNLKKTFFDLVKIKPKPTYHPPLNYYIDIPEIPLEFTTFSKGNERKFAIKGMVSSDDFTFKNEIVKGSQYQDQNYILVFSQTPNSIGYGQDPKYRLVPTMTSKL